MCNFSGFQSVLVSTVGRLWTPKDELRIDIAFNLQHYIATLNPKQYGLFFARVLFQVRQCNLQSRLVSKAARLRTPRDGLWSEIAFKLQHYVATLNPKRYGLFFARVLFQGDHCILQTGLVSEVTQLRTLAVGLWIDIAFKLQHYVATLNPKQYGLFFARVLFQGDHCNLQTGLVSKVTQLRTLAVALWIDIAFK